MKTHSRFIVAIALFTMTSLYGTSLYGQNSTHPATTLPPAQPPESDSSEGTTTKDSFGGQFEARPGGYSYTPESKLLTPPPSPYGTPAYGNPVVVPFPFNPVMPVNPLQALLHREPLPRSVQGTWYETTANNTYLVYVFRATDYDSYEMDPITGQLLVGANGQPVRLRRDGLMYRENTLTLFDGNSTLGPFLLTDAPAALPQGIMLAPLDGSAARYLTARPQPLVPPNGWPGQIGNGRPPRGQVKGRNAKQVSFTKGPSTAMIYESTPGVWIESGPNGQFAYQEIDRDEWSVYLQDLAKGAVIQLDLRRRMILQNGQDVFRIDDAH